MKAPYRTEPVRILGVLHVLMSWRALCVGASMALLTPGLASAQDIDEVNARLSRVERVLDQSLLEQLQRVDGLERELRQLRGEIESLNNEISTLKRRNADLYDDTDFRLTELETLAESGALLAGQADGGFAGLDEGAFIEGGETGGFGGGGLSEPGLDGTALQGGGTGSGSASGGAGVASPGVFVSERARPGTAITEVRTNATQAEKAAYTRAYDLLARGQNDAAVAEFDSFLDEYPAGPYSFNAWYWKGEAMYAERRFEEAIDNFRQVTEKFPGSIKVPDARLKIGFSLYELGQFDSARQILERVRDEFQGRSAAVLARKRLQKMDREGQ